MDRVISTFNKAFIFTKLRIYAKFYDNKTLAKIFQFNVREVVLVSNVKHMLKVLR